MLAAAAVTLGGSCGLQTIPFLAPPTNISVSVADESVSFTHDTANDVDYFSGYEIYYRLYVNPADASTAQSAIESSTAPGISVLTSYGYRRITRETESFQGSPVRPLIPFSSTQKAQSVVVTLNFQYSLTSPPDPTADWSASSTATMRRNTNNPSVKDSTRYKRFFTNYTGGGYQQSDGDIQGVYTAGQVLYIVLVALAYGTDLNTLQPVYSEPVVLYPNAYVTNFQLPVDQFPTS